MNDKFGGIGDRFRFVLGDRKRGVWRKGCGMVSTTTEHLYKGSQPGWKPLSILFRYENVSPLWLVEGIGAPFIVHRCVDADALSHELESLLKQHRWSVFLLTDQRLAGVVLHRPDTYELVSDGELQARVNYRQVKIIGATVSPKLVPLLASAGTEGRVKYLRCVSDQMQALVNGWVSSYALFGDDKTAGMIASARPCSLSDLQAMFSPQPKEQVNLIDLGLMRRIVTLIEGIQLEDRLELSPDQMARIISAAYRHAQRLGVSSEELRSEDLRGLIDAA